MWGGPLHNPWFVQKILDMLPIIDKDTYGTIPRIEGMLTMARDEAILDEPVDATQPPDAEPVNATQLPDAEPMDATKSPDAENSPQPTEIPTLASPSVPFPSLPPSTRANHPFFILPARLASTIHCACPSDAAMRGALYHLGGSLWSMFLSQLHAYPRMDIVDSLPTGYRTSRSHTKPGSIVTDAPWSVIWEIMRYVTMDPRSPEVRLLILMLNQRVC